MANLDPRRGGPPTGARLPGAVETGSLDPESLPEPSGVRYGIDARDRLTFVDEAWDRFAQANDAPELNADHILERSLWDFITHDSVREIYRRALKRARYGQPVLLTFRADSPWRTRLMELEIRDAGNEVIVFQSRTLAVHERRTQSLLDRQTFRGPRSVRMCSWCQCIEPGDGRWLDLDEVARQGVLDSFREPPRLAHGVCPTCYYDALAGLRSHA